MRSHPARRLSKFQTSSYDPAERLSERDVFTINSQLDERLDRSANAAAATITNRATWHKIQSLASSIAPAYAPQALHRNSLLLSAFAYRRPALSGGRSMGLTRVIEFASDCNYLHKIQSTRISLSCVEIRDLGTSLQRFITYNSTTIARTCLCDD